MRSLHVTKTGAKHSELESQYLHVYAIVHFGAQLSKSAGTR